MAGSIISAPSTEKPNKDYNHNISKEPFVKVVVTTTTGTATSSNDAAVMEADNGEATVQDGIKKGRGGSEDTSASDVSMVKEVHEEREALPQVVKDDAGVVEIDQEAADLTPAYEDTEVSIDEAMTANDNVIVKDGDDDDGGEDYVDAGSKPASMTTSLEHVVATAGDTEEQQQQHQQQQQQHQQQQQQQSAGDAEQQQQQQQQQSPDKNHIDDSHRDETHEHVSDISASSEGSGSDGMITSDWVEGVAGGGGNRTSDPQSARRGSGTGNIPRNRSFTICSVLTNTSEHGSIRSQRENVDRLLMTGGGASIGRGGGGSSLGGSDISPSQQAHHQHATMRGMDHHHRVGGPHHHHHDPNSSPFAYTYDQNYYKSPGDWLRFIPRRSYNEIGARSSNSSGGGDGPSLGGSLPMQHSNGGYVHGGSPGYGNTIGQNINPDLYYRGFDNTRIRTGFGNYRYSNPNSRIRQTDHNLHMAAHHRHIQQQQQGVGIGPNGEMMATGDANLSMDQNMNYANQYPPPPGHAHHMYPNLISVPIDEEEGGGERDYNENGNTDTISPPLEIHCNSNEDCNDPIHDHAKINNLDHQMYNYSNDNMDHPNQHQPPTLHELRADIHEQIGITSANPSEEYIVPLSNMTHSNSEGAINGDPMANDPRALAPTNTPPAPSPPPPSVEPGMFESSLRIGGIERPPTNPSTVTHSLGPLPPHIQEKKMHEATWDSKWETYACRVDQRQEDRSVEIPIFSMARPHMRGFHYAWLTFFFAFLAWFAITPLLAEVQKSLDLTKEQIWTSSICSVAGAVVTRCVAGLFCDIYGARWMSAAVLFICGVPTMFTGCVNTAVGLSVLRLVTGIGGSAFVTCQYWTCTMFTKEVAGTANALAAGWGNLGGGVAQIFVGSMLFPFFKWIYGLAGKEDPAEWSWRTCCVIPGLICTIFTYAVLKYADDSPKGNYQKRKHLGLMQTPSAMQHIKSAIHDHNTWLLLIQYGCCFGVELTTSNAAALYFKEEFELSTEAAAAVASTFGWMNLFARGLGGFMSDVSNAYKGMRGRLFWQLSCFLLEGAFVMVFSKATTLAGAIVALMAFSIFVQGAEGSTFGIVPYLNPNVTGTVAGIVGAGGNAGAVIFSILFRQLEYRQAFFVMGATTSVISLLSSFVWIKGYEGLFFNTRITPVDPPHEERLNNSNRQQLQQHAPNTPELQQVNEEKDDELQGNQSRSYIDTDPQSSISGPLSH